MEIEIGGRSEKSLCGQQSTAVDQELASNPAPPGAISYSVATTGLSGASGLCIFTCP